jgi:hypothetical protein
MEEVLRVSGQIEEFDPVTGDLAGYELNEDGEDAAVSVPGT